MTTSFLLNVYIAIHVIGLTPVLVKWHLNHVKSMKTLHPSLHPTKVELGIEVCTILFLWTIIVPFALLWNKLHDWHYKMPTK